MGIASAPLRRVGIGVKQVEPPTEDTLRHDYTIKWTAPQVAAGAMGLPIALAESAQAYVDALNEADESEHTHEETVLQKKKSFALELERHMAILMSEEDMEPVARLINLFARKGIPKGD